VVSVIKNVSIAYIYNKNEMGDAPKFLMVEF